MQTRKELVLSQEQIAKRVQELGAQITRDYQGRTPIFIGVLKGSFIFLADLVRQVDLPLKIDFVRLASYGDKDYSDGNVRLVKDIELPIEGEDVIIVEDIVDIGYTLAFVVEHLKKKRPASLKVCVFINKQERRKVEVKLDYVGFEASGFLVGYGLDFSEQYRHLPAVYRLVKEESNKQ